MLGPVLPSIRRDLPPITGEVTVSLGGARWQSYRSFRPFRSDDFIGRQLLDKSRSVSGDLMPIVMITEDFVALLVSV